MESNSLIITPRVQNLHSRLGKIWNGLWYFERTKFDRKMKENHEDWRNLQDVLLIQPDV